jgi:hypothetical protein
MSGQNITARDVFKRLEELKALKVSRSSGVGTGRFYRSLEVDKVTVLKEIAFPYPGIVVNYVAGLIKDAGEIVGVFAEKYYHDDEEGESGCIGYYAAIRPTKAKYVYDIRIPERNRLPWEPPSTYINEGTKEVEIPVIPEVRELIEMLSSAQAQREQIR